tara:strand:- start:2312 stop:3208 length:897 start_codon:yes stop_codon:yes gene_type:complete
MANSPKPKIVAEHCCNHMGQIEIAKQMIDAAARAGADVAKFQKWEPKVALSFDHYSASHPNPHHSFGEPYGKHRENLEFSIEEHKELKSYCLKVGIKYAVSVFDHISALSVLEVEPEYIKIPSQKNLKIDMYDCICKEFSGEIHISTGMTTDYQVDGLLNEIARRTTLKRVVLYSTTSTYPCKYEDLYLLRIESFKEKYGKEVKSLGFSGHHNGIAADIAAITLGAEFIERHFTLDRTMKGTDHAASLEPQGLSKLVRDAQLVHQALEYRPNSILGAEQEAFQKVKSHDAEVFDSEKG